MALLLCGAGRAGADHIVLAPDANTIENGVEAEYAFSPYPSKEDWLWLRTFSGSGIELELERLERTTDYKKRYAFDFEYPVLPELNAAPAIAVGMLDAFGTSVEHPSAYLAATKSIFLSKRQKRTLRDFNLTLGLGTGYIGGPYLGVQTRLTLGLRLQAEVYRRRLDVSLALPLARYAQAKVYSLNGKTFYGISFTLAR